VPRVQPSAVSLAGLLLSGGFAYWWGAHGYGFLATVVLAYLPVTWLVHIIAAVVLPPRLQIKGFTTLNLRDPGA
jgi:hypothetical protein